ncbi:L-threonylcarbamoyladenylate synthase [Croceicoccus mobilis]|uniref:Threonylcarbamoyl-AMP synthase n=1 Tax=Croceicoccus mobilis TaxID=1703339 RepID=A0A916YSU8_9SPHN|nr:L-threonylcarbamoyladenylate synthase [Croceicoccus mobilis]GGD60016.1 threonylcarbamoyl-AMP synthase [Croceicoccus mobilis]
MSAANARNDCPEILALSEEALKRAHRLLEAGKPVAIPTETVYGLAARADRDAAVAAIYEAKGRPSFNPLIVHVSDRVAAEGLALFDSRAAKLADRFWPGPLTLVLPRREEAALAAATTAGLPTVAIRCPAHPAARALLQLCAFPLAAPSANRSGAVSPTTAAHVADSLAGRIDLVVDGGATAGGIESTIVAVDADGWRMLRPGPITADDIGACLGEAMSEEAGKGIEAPGQLASHYAPGKPVRLHAGDAEPDEYLIGFGDIDGDTNLSETGDLYEAAARLYACLHMAAASDRPRVAVASVPETGVGAAINDRLRRAAA